MQQIEKGNIIQAYIKSQDKNKQYILGNELKAGVGCILYQAQNIQDESDVIFVKKYKQISENALELYKLMEQKRLDNVLNILFVQESDANSYFIGMDKYHGTLAELCYKLEKESYKEFFDEMIKQIAFGVYSIHANKIIHRDLKPENVVYKMSGNHYYFMINNIQSANKKSEDVKQRKKQENPQYMAPELIQNCNYYHSSVDIWAFGVMIYQLLTNQEFFQGNSIQEVKNSILQYHQCNLERDISFRTLPKPYQNLLKMMIHEDPRQRINIEQVLEHLDKKEVILAQSKYGYATSFSDWDYFMQLLHPDVKTKLLYIQTKLRPLFVKQRDLIYKILIKIGEDLNQIQNEQIQIEDNRIGFSCSDKQIILKYTTQYFNEVKEQYIANQRWIRN